MSPERAGLMRRIGLFSGFGLFFFFIAFVLAFPFARIGDLVVSLAAKQGYDVEIGKVGPAFGVGVSFADVTMQGRSTDGKKPAQVKVQSATIKVSPLAQLMGNLAVSVSAETMGGAIEAQVESSKTKGAVKVNTENLSMAEIPGVKEAVNLPLGGNLDLSIDMAFPENKNANASGAFSWKCSACSVGDGKEKLKVAGNPLLAEGISFPRIRLGDFIGKLAFEKGVGKLQAVQAKSPDGELIIEGEVRLADPVKLSNLDLYVRFKFSDALLKANDKIQLILQFAESAGKRPDGFFGFRLNGSLSNLGGVQWMKQSPFATAVAGAAAPRPVRSPGKTASGQVRNTASVPPIQAPSEPEPAVVVSSPAAEQPQAITESPPIPPSTNEPRYPIDPVLSPPPPAPAVDAAAPKPAP